MEHTTTSQTRLLLLSLLLLASVDADRYTRKKYEPEPVQDIQVGAYPIGQVGPGVLVMDQSIQAGMFGLLDRGTEVSKGLIEGGGSMQLLLVIAFCCAVLCCASMSISPWHKSENFFLRKAMALLYAAEPLALESLGRKGEAGLLGGQEAGATSGKGRQKGQPAQKGVSNASLAAAEKQSRKGARSKRRKASVLREPGDSSSPQIVKSLSLGSSQSSSCECGSMLSGEPDEADSLASPIPLESVSSDLSAESDISHLGKLTAEALSCGGEPRKGQKVASGKRHVSVRVDTAAPAATPVQQSSSSSSSISSPSATPPVSSPAQPTKKALAPKTPARLARPVNAGSSKSNSSPRRERGGKRAQATGGGEKPATLAHVLVVPRCKPKGKDRRARSAGYEDRDGPVAPGTPDSAASTAFSVQSNQRAPQEPPPRLTKPYAEVARESVQRSAPQSPGVSFQTPKSSPVSPAPSEQLSALPRHAAFAAPFVPGASMARNRTALAPPFSPNRSHMPPMVQQLVLPPSPVPSPPPPPSPTISSPFPGMSLHRRSPANSALTALPLGGHGFAGGFDSIWSTNLGAERSFWQPLGIPTPTNLTLTSASWEGSQSLLESLSPQPHLPRQDSC